MFKYALTLIALIFVVLGWLIWRQAEQTVNNLQQIIENLFNKILDPLKQVGRVISEFVPPEIAGQDIDRVLASPSVIAKIEAKWREEFPDVILSVSQINSWKSYTVRQLFTECRLFNLFIDLKDQELIELLLS